MVPIWYFDFDGGDSIEPFIRQAKILNAKDEDIIRFTYQPRRGDRIGETDSRPRGQGKDIFLDFLKDFNSLFDNVGADGEWNKPGMPKVLVFDTVTSLQDIMLDFVLAMAGHDLGAPKTDARADFGRAMNKMVELINSCKSLPVLSIFIAHEKLDKNEVTSEVRIDPSFQGILAQQIGREFGTILYSTTKKVGQDIKYIWMTKPSGLVKSPGLRHHDNLPLEIEQDYRLVLNLED